MFRENYYGSDSEFGGVEPLKKNHFSLDTYTDGDMTDLSQTKVIWAMSQNVEYTEFVERPTPTKQPDAILLLSCMAHMAVQNQMKKLEALTQQVKEKVEAIYNSSELSNTNRPAYFANSSGGFRSVPSVLFINTNKNPGHNNYPSQP